MKEGSVNSALHKPFLVGLYPVSSRSLNDYRTQSIHAPLLVKATPHSAENTTSIVNEMTNRGTAKVGSRCPLTVSLPYPVNRRSSSVHRRVSASGTRSIISTTVPRGGGRDDLRVVRATEQRDAAQRAANVAGSAK
ncbi:hypothetical protein PRIPAC_86028 [Pristionchus pacificus]|uniref:Uncharacterized protein n=1 Tax=Pristionchus pacificus TaxID=54126 RepID=A0A2A6BUE3_PRIPA|nr:hypothetical protein PRIPAC_86028 [Pristionchus pacificus]|eukprot:PDM69534.1 hypothetical protein PRIPAC_44630 [Pristionchus pacificus]